MDFKQIIKSSLEGIDNVLEVLIEKIFSSIEATAPGFEEKIAIKASIMADCYIILSEADDTSILYFAAMRIAERVKDSFSDEELEHMKRRVASAEFKKINLN
jgi:hypothetical protein